MRKSAKEVKHAEDQLHNILKDGYSSDSSMKSAGGKSKKRLTVGMYYNMLAENSHIVCTAIPHL